MKFTETALAGVCIIDVDYQADARGGFARTFDAAPFAAQGLNPHVEQAATSFNAHAGTLRGLHFQDPPFSQAKLVRVTAGAVYDVVVDLRRDSSTYGRHVGVELSASTRRMLYIPQEFAHGFLTLEDATELHYQFDTAYAPGAEGGIVYSDPDLAINWPQPVVVISDRDRVLPRLRDLR